MHAWTHAPKMIVSIWRNLRCLSTSKKSTSTFRFFRDIAKILQTCYLVYFGHAWLHKTKVILSTWRLFSCLSEGKKLKFIPHVFLEILQSYASFLFWVLWEYLAMYWPCLATHTQNHSINLSKTSRSISILKIHLIIHFFLEINHAIWLANRIWTLNWRTRILPQKNGSVSF